MKQKRPNIVLIFTDQQRFDSLSCYGNKALQTPGIDRLAEEGTRFDNCYVNNPVCTPSRASLFTGRPLSGHGVYKLHDILPQETKMLPEYLKESGYETALIGKLHVSAAMFEYDRRNAHDGFDIYDWCHEPSLFFDAPFNAYSTWLKANHPEFYERYKQEGRQLKHIPKPYHFSTWVGETAENYIKNRDKSKPFFTFVSFFDPHNPYDQHPKACEEKVNAKAFEPLNRKRREAFDKSDGIERSHSNCYLGSYDSYSDEAIADMRLGYHAGIALIDEQVERICSRLKVEGIYDETMILYASDHGDMLGDHELLAKGAFFYEAGVKVPMIIKWPKEMGDVSVCRELVQPHDLFATLLTTAGVSEERIRAVAPTSLNLSETVKNQKGHAFALCEYRNSGIDMSRKAYDPPIHATMLRYKNYKLNLYHGEPMDSCGELYDLTADPKEQKNLWQRPDACAIQTEMLVALANALTENDLALHGSVGGTATGVSAKIL